MTEKNYLNSSQLEPEDLDPIARRHGLIVFTEVGDFGDSTVIARNTISSRLDAKLQGWLPLGTHFAYDAGQKGEFYARVTVLPKASQTERRLLEAFIIDLQSETGKRIALRYLPVLQRKK